jgi:hypothetical protein
MAPRKPRLATINEAKTFDFDAFIQGFKREEFTRNLYQRADLLPRLSELDDIINSMQGRLDTARQARGDEPEARGIDDVDIVAQLEQRLNALTAEFNEIYDEYEASAVRFTFRIPDQKNDRLELKEALEAGGVPLEMPDDATDEELLDQADKVAMYSMSLTCSSHPMTVEQWRKLRETVGEPAFQSLARAWVEATKAANPTAPFSRKVLTTPPETEESSVA